MKTNEQKELDDLFDLSREMTPEEKKETSFVRRI